MQWSASTADSASWSPTWCRTEVALATRDAASFYARLGFEEVYTDRRGPYPRTTMRRPLGG